MQNNLDQMASNIVGVNEQLEVQTQLWNHLFSFINSMSLKCAVELRIPDIIYDHGSPISLTDLAAAIPIPSSKTHHLYRLMRILVHTNIFNLDTSSSGANAEEEEGYILTPSSNLLVKSKRDCNLSPFLLMMLDQSHVNPWHCFGQWFKSEEPTAFKISYGATMWEVANQCPEFNNKFNDAMACEGGFAMRTLISRCGYFLFGKLKSLVDVGGGTGGAARAIAGAFPDLKVTVLDLPHVVADLPPHTGITFIGGDMFQQIPPGQAVFLKWILHDWNDEECVKILQKCKKAIPSKEEGGKVMILEMVLNSKKEDYKYTETQLFFDLMMLVLHPGREREEDEWKKIFMDAGFASYKITPILGLRSMIEVYP